jgi:hypothetical protein
LSRKYTEKSRKKKKKLPILTLGYLEQKRHPKEQKEEERLSDSHLIIRKQYLEPVKVAPRILLTKLMKREREQGGGREGEKRDGEAGRERRSSRRAGSQS